MPVATTGDSASARHPEAFDVAVIGSGIEGSILGAVLARNGVRVLLLDVAAQPDARVDETTNAYTSALLRVIGERYGVPEIKRLASFSETCRKISSASGRTQNYGFVYHRERRPQEPNEVNQFIPPALLPTQTHLFRPDVDSDMLRVALRYGAVSRVGTRVADIDVLPGQGVRIVLEDAEELFASYVVDVSGEESLLAQKFALREQPTRLRHQSRLMFTHMSGVRPYDDCLPARQHGQPGLWHRGTLHHVFDGGWLWVMPFGNHRRATNRLCSVGLVLDQHRYPADGARPQEEFDAFLDRFPSIADQFTLADPQREWFTTERLQYSSHSLVGERFCLISSAAGYVDPLFSQGLSNSLEVVNALAWRLIAARRDGDWSVKRFRYVEELQQALLDWSSEFAASALSSFRNYELWNAMFRIWSLGVVFSALKWENTYFAYRRTGDERVFHDIERAKYIGSPFPASEGFNSLVRSACSAVHGVDSGSVVPEEAARGVFTMIRDADFVPPQFGFGDPERNFYRPTPPRMVKALLWSRKDAPPEVGSMIRSAVAGLLRERLHIL